MKVYVVYDEARAKKEGVYSSIRFKIKDVTLSQPYEGENWIAFHREDYFEVYVIWVRYDDGDTCGKTDGHWDIVDVVSSIDEKESIISNLKNHKHKNSDRYENTFATLRSIHWKKYSLKKERTSGTIYM